jgi:hypothetical protein
MKKFLILVPLFLSSFTLVGAGVKAQWTPNQLATTQKVCIMAALQANPKATSGQASYFCKCALDEAATKWAYADFTNNEEQYTQQLGNEGTISRCTRAAFQINPGLHKVEPGLNQMRQVLEPLGQALLNKPGVVLRK